jgi:lipoic acid synthetase
MPSHDSPAAPADAVSRTLARHPRPLGGDTARHVGPPVLSLTGMVLNNQKIQSPNGQSPNWHDANVSSSLDLGQLDFGLSHLRIPRKPDWIRARAPAGEGFDRLKNIIDTHRLHTVCQEASCPNIGECWNRGTATIMILGDTCTRACGFCNVKTGRPPQLDLDEPRRVAESLKLMNLKHVVITSVNRDELDDGGAAIWAETIHRVHKACPWMSVEVLVGDFCGDEKAIQTVIEARPEILAHNLETVKRMHPAVRPQANYQRSLNVLRQIKENGLITKTGIMVGIGERDDEVLQLMDDVQKGLGVRDQGLEGHGAFNDGFTNPQPLTPNPFLTDILTIGQYLQPTRNHLPIDRWVTPEQFMVFKREGLARGFKVVESGPLVRSSYHAEEQAERLSPDRRETVEAMERLLAQAKPRA